MVNAVAPTVSILPNALVPTQRTGRQALVALVGLCWIWLGLAGSVWYMWLLTPSFRNDLWWSYFNATGYQVLLIDVINDLLSTTIELPALVNVASVAIYRDYAGAVLPPLAHPVYAARLATHGLSSIAYVIPNLRNVSATEALWLPTQYCYVDFARRWELAHTEARQHRCAATMATNGAVFLEAVLRNQDWNAIALAAGAGFAPAIERGLQATADGRAWMAATATANTTVIDEIAYWIHHGLRTYELQWQTYNLPGLDQRLVIENALSIEQSVTLKSSTTRRGPWTTMNLNFFFINEIYTVGTACNMSLIRNTTKYFTSDYCISYTTTDLEGALFLSDDNGNFVAQTSLSHTFIGPFLSVDMWVLSPPPQLIALVAAITSALHDALETNLQFAIGVQNLRAMSLQPLPLPWRTDALGNNYLYYGGNHMCLGGTARGYVQAPFTADAACELQPPLTINVFPEALLYSLLASSSHGDAQSNSSSISSTVCDLQDAMSCASDIDIATALLQRYPLSGGWSQLAINASAAVAALNVSLMQYASDNDAVEYSLLWLPILEPSWRFYGHVMLFDWVRGVREVVAFEGDAATLVLMSDMYDTATTEPSTATLSRASRAIYILLVYSSVLLGLLVVATTLYAGMAKLHFLGVNLTYFHRVAGSTWLGRPLLFLRGASALILLGTAPIGVASVHGTAALHLPSRSIYESMLLAWEALWITYVLQELLLPFSDKGIHSAGYVSSGILWVVYVGLDSASPLSVETLLQHDCVGLAYCLSCSSVRIQLGSVVRVLWLFLLQGLVVPIALMAAYGHRRKRGRRQSRGVHGLMLSGSGFAFLATPDEEDAPFDAIAGLFSGLLRLTYKRRDYTFDIKLWTIVRGRKQRARSHSKLDGPSTSTIPKLAPIAPRPWWLGWVYSLGGMAYIGIAIAGSLSYLRLSESTLTNDLIWVGFDLRGDHPFLATWLLEALALGAENTTRPLHTLNVAAPFNATVASTISFADHDGAMLHYSELNSVAVAIPALRSLPASEIPWVFTGYCYVDFNQSFGVAHTAARQARCASYASNGAVYMESFLRNVVWSDWVNYWGEAFETSIATSLVSSAAGLAFLNRLGEPWAPIEDEVDYWRRHGIAFYQLQWQNFKTIGLINAYSIVNAYGAAYPFTLQATAGALRLGKQTSYKMYWGLANDLSGVLNNGTDLGGKSLVRDTAMARNGTLTSVYLQTGVLASPLSAGLSAIQSFLGPFGSIDMQYVPVPVDVRRAAGAAMAIVHDLRLAHGAAYAALPHPLYLNPVPFAWLRPTFFVLGGSVLCVPDTSPLIITGGLQPLFSFESSCSANTGRTIASIPSQDHLLFAAAYAHTITNITHVCLQMRTQAYACEPMLRNTLAFLSQANLSALHSTWAPRLLDALTPLQIELFQVGRPKASAPMQIYHLPLLASPPFSFFANVLLYDWVLGNREVVRFTGDVTAITLIGDGLRPRVQATDASQLPTVFALYSHRSVQYVTYVMIALAATTALYAVVSRGHVEGLNLLELSRVGGIVWVGRPLIALRSITALCLLSTSRLELDYDGYNSAFLSQNAPWYSAGIAANEVTWLVGIVNDIAIVFTQDLTMLYTIYNSLLVLLLAACITILLPIEPTVSVARACHIESLDWQVVCNSGQVAVGDWRRLLFLIGTVFGCNGACYWLVKLGCRRPVAVYARPSLLLSGGARYLFDHGPWMHEGVYYMDRASAVLNGLLSLRYRSVLYIFDVKTWRLHRMTSPTHSTPVPPRLARGIPLLDA
ncbi:hypothetical protein SPRG_15305 [Saprolegnia parasitica CBS 223.65]|uniref:Uncharacterized protein n=1 Tax=Saprolegnia parasitica (strain CBS 223.65) TaxID=695850 RepID=A0A067BLX1_SAPPC|nr:hypothetical protein SPRG_15305 [Saprolegnia parasitica CBS 223.65]KDO19499.1 hypothetical protein SPRG_15305 [Saprolegnia parasitica CBS 223.65]|eukprot:XP_012209802.1 hypothetical protein SPRG_15305 [Saprolegnia parasitica CBS 223.65]